jgi:hypothetical protein
MVWGLGFVVCGLGFVKMLVNGYEVSGKISK